MNNNLIAVFKKIVGETYVLTSKEDLLSYGYDATPGFFHLPATVIIPENTGQVSQVMAIANKEKIPVYVRGAGTNLSAGTVPTQGGIVLLMTRMNRIIEVDTENLVAVAEPGVVVSDLNKIVEQSGLIYPPDPGTVTTATLGGTVAENSGGLRGLKYGVTKHYVMGLEVVLADGRIMNTGGKNVKDVAGYDLTKLFTGAEGTLCVITKIIVKLVPAPETRKSMMAIFNNLDNAGNSIASIIANKIIPATLEIMDNATIRTVEDYAHVGLPVNAEAVLLIEVDGIPAVVEKEAAKVLEVLKANKADEIRVAKDTADRDKIWAARRAALPALAKLRPTTFVEDATVPRSKVPDMIRAINEIAAKYKVRIGTFGHAGDGNMHPTLVCDIRDKEEMERVYKAMDEIFATAIKLGGTLSGEHGIGLGKLRYMEDQFGPVGMEVMRTIKKALDPNGILNPGKLVGEC
ncbi:MAG TPA: FAD-linked oxidase C-terminal domain-containing protein [Methylomusa anaerophila]|uniref:Putative FAD-linked oxidoreductase n=1 Tax=Methylomusa anaerophila TaxID=1930071 RepID=A0A348AFR6_9FIRM|nr:FAD-linked oxidase C-terminal domain-containing protein [Methylomusa anaerophila]BBB89914.1 putative FAD-linked oxidoreductase [Methylomusa anaerophila]HML90574.1 FAD-linked oxidase C-terminal domain-containing protein [Methylomusa anaerophila]